MYLASTASHFPLAVFTELEAAKVFLCIKEKTSSEYAQLETLKMKSNMFKVSAGYPQKTLGYIVSGISVNPNYDVD